MSVEDFHQFCGANRDLRIERTAVGDIIVPPPHFLIRAIAMVVLPSNSLIGATKTGQASPLTPQRGLPYRMERPDPPMRLGFGAIAGRP